MLTKKEKILSIALALLVCLALSGSFAYGFYYGRPGIAEQPINDTQNINNLLKDLEKNVQDNPQNSGALETLANRYFDIGVSIRNTNPEAAKPYFAKAAEAYQKLLTFNGSRADVQTDLATALYYSDQTDQADEAYKKAIALNPDYLQARVNYGIFLLFVRNDQEAGRKELTKALQLQPTGDILQKIQSLLKDIGTITPSAAVDYTKDIEPFIYQNCVQCHGPGGSMAKSSLHTYGGVIQFVSAGNPEKSTLLQKIKAGHPRKYKDESINLVEQWIINGALGPK